MTQFQVSRRIRLFLALLGLALVAGIATTALVRTAGPVAAAGEPNSYEISFTKWAVCCGGGIGVVGGDVNGTLVFTSQPTPLPGGTVTKIHATYVVTDVSGERSFTAVLEGKSNSQTADRVLNGVITEGWLDGAQVHVEFLRVAACTGNPSPCFVGTIRIMAASAD